MWKIVRSLAACAGACLTLTAPGWAQTAPAATASSTPRFKLASSTLLLAPAETTGVVTVTVLADLQPNDPLGQEATLADHTPAAGGVIVAPAKIVASNELRQVWRFPVTIQNFPKAATQSRVFVISYGGIYETLTYSLSNVNSTAFTWSVKAPPEWNVATASAFPLAIRVGDVAATGIRLEQADLVSTDALKRTLGRQHFELCENASGSCTAPGSSLAPRTPHGLYLRPSAPLPPGIFKGNVSVAVTEKVDPDVLAVTLYSPRPDGVLLGVLALAAGVTLSLILQVLGRAWFQRRREQETIALLAKQLQTLQSDFDKLDGAVKSGAADWRRKAEQLKADIGAISDFVRPFIPQPFELEVAKIGDFKTAVENSGAALTHLRTLLRAGLQEVAAIHRAHPGHDPDVKAAAAAIAVMGPSARLVDDINLVLANLRAAVNAPPRVTLAAEPRTPADELRDIRFQLLAASVFIWLAWGVVSVLTGALVLIYTNPAFGTDYDLLVCLVWGLGITAAGQQAAQLSPSAVAGSIGVKVPGTK